MNSCDLAILTQHHLDCALDCIEADDRAGALIKLAAVEESARRTAAAIHAEARQHIAREACALRSPPGEARASAEAVAACTSPVTASALLWPLVNPHP